MITISALKWVPPFAAGNVRDHRVRWVLNEVGWDYRVRLLDAPAQASADYRAQQPFGQVPCMEEDGRPPMFETGAIVLDVATRAGKLIPPDGPDRVRVIEWLFAALNSIEPFLANVVEVEIFLQDEADKARRRPQVVPMAEKRLGQLQAALGDRPYLVGDGFTVADLMMASVLKLAGPLRLREKFPTLAAYRDRCFERPAYKKAIADQRAEIDAHAPADMKLDAVGTKP